jgi:ectoine hydroxylase-related dioxygenase (phytanoyl-CoA dioxygenase family)
MNKHLSTQPLTAEQHARAMQAYIDDGVRRAMALGNRGPIRLDGDGKLAEDILNDYREHGFYVFTNVVSAEELAELRRDVEQVLAVAPNGPDDPEQGREAHGDPAHGLCFQRPSYRFAKPLSDPLGGTSENKGRHPVKMEGPLPADEAPEWTVERLIGNLQLMDSCLRLYGHHGLLSVAEAVLGPDFVPYNEVTFVKEPGLGPSVAWHQDGTTHWDAPDWDQGAHGYNFMTQLYPSTPGNGVWVLPGSHKLGKADIKQLVAESGSERIDGAVPMICDAGDVFITNRQLVHGSFANSSGDRRVTLNAGFFPRRRVLNVTTSHLNGKVETFDAARIHERCRVIAVAIDARQQRYPDEPRYCYQPLAAEQDDNRWNEETRQSVIRDYNVRDFYI